MPTANKQVKEENKNKVIQKTANEGAVSSAPKSCLFNKKIKLKIVPSFRNKICNNESESTMFSGTSRSIILPKSAITRRFVDPLTDAEREYLEWRTGENLNVQDKESYYRKLRIILRKDDMDLNKMEYEMDCSEPYGFMEYKLLLVAPEVAEKSDAYPADKLFYIEDIEAIVNSTYSLEDKRDKVIEFRIGIKENKKAIYDFLRIYFSDTPGRKKFDEKTPREWMYNYLCELTSNSKNIDLLHEIVKEYKEDKATYTAKILIHDAILKGEVKLTSNGYTTASSEFMGRSVTEAVAWLANPKNQQTRLHIEQRVKL